MKIKVLCLGISAKEIEVDTGTTVEQAIQKAEFPKDNSYTRHVNGSHCMDSDILNDGDILTLVPQVKGGSELSSDLQAQLLEIVFYEITVLINSKRLH